MQVKTEEVFWSWANELDSEKKRNSELRLFMMLLDEIRMLRLDVDELREIHKEEINHE